MESDRDSPPFIGLRIPKNTTFLALGCAVFFCVAHTKHRSRHSLRYSMRRRIGLRIDKKQPKKPESLAFFSALRTPRNQAHINEFQTMNKVHF